MSVMAGAPVSRNAPCPCGSGRRYRECHGAIDASPPQPASRTTAAATYRPKGPDWDGVDPAERARLAALMDAALARQAANDQSGAARLYREVLAVAPQTHDALHMLAVAQWGLGDLGDAWRLIERASALRDPYPAIATNRETLQRARAHQARIEAERRAERALPDLLTRLASRAPAGPGLASSEAGEPLHLIVGTGDPDDDVAWIATRLMRVLAPWDPTSWTVTSRARRIPVRRVARPRRPRPRRPHGLARACRAEPRRRDRRACARRRLAHRSFRARPRRDPPAGPGLPDVGAGRALWYLWPGTP
ncbi:MAG: SEC-C domain-containing protein [Betaproteobacteria bacterium]|nr:SEC-C domain-containing protein [Betaproteobacteria bacterium]